MVILTFLKYFLFCFLTFFVFNPIHGNLGSEIWALFEYVKIIKSSVY